MRSGSKIAGVAPDGPRDGVPRAIEGFRELGLPSCRVMAIGDVAFRKPPKSELEAEGPRDGVLREPPDATDIDADGGRDEVTTC